MLVQDGFQITPMLVQDGFTVTDYEIMLVQMADNIFVCTEWTKNGRQDPARTEWVSNDNDLRTGEIKATT